MVAWLLLCLAGACLARSASALAFWAGTDCQLIELSELSPDGGTISTYRFRRTNQTRMSGRTWMSKQPVFVMLPRMGEPSSSLSFDAATGAWVVATAGRVRLSSSDLISNRWNVRSHGEWVSGAPLFNTTCAPTAGRLRQVWPNDKQQWQTPTPAPQGVEPATNFSCPRAPAPPARVAEAGRWVWVGRSARQQRAHPRRKIRLATLGCSCSAPTRNYGHYLRKALEDTVDVEHWNPSQARWLRRKVLESISLYANNTAQHVADFIRYPTKLDLSKNRNGSMIGVGVL